VKTRECRPGEARGARGCHARGSGARPAALVLDVAQELPELGVEPRPIRCWRRTRSGPIAAVALVGPSSRATRGGWAAADIVDHLDGVVRARVVADLGLVGGRHRRRSGEALPVALDRAGAADAFAGARIEPAARARVGRGDEQKRGGELEGAMDAIDCDGALFERLAQSLDGRARECCVARPEAGLVANRLAVTGVFPRAISGAPKGTAPGAGEPDGDAEAAGRAAPDVR